MRPPMAARMRRRCHRTAYAFAEGEAALVHAATTMGFEDFSRVVDYWLSKADPDGADESDMERADRRRPQAERRPANGPK